MAYRLGDKYQSIRPVPVSVEARADDGSLQTVKRTLYLTHLGPVVVTDETPWSNEHVYVIRDVNYENDRGGDQYHDLGAATNVTEIREALARHQGVSFVNTIAADASGNALYADMSAIPFVTADQIERCDTGLSRIGTWRIIVLDGSDPSCDWQRDPGAAAPGLMPPDQQPSLITDTYVSNSNDSHWLSNPDLRLEGFSPIIGNEKQPRSLRTRAGLNFIEEVLDRGERFTPEIVQALLFSHRHFGAELLLDDILTICKGEASTLDIAAACGILEDWDRRQDVDSVGAQIYNELWNEIVGDITNHLAIPFDVNDPLHTPRDLTVDSPATRGLVMDGLGSALERLAAANVSPLSPWGDVQFAIRNDEKIGIPGGNGGAGMYSVIGARLNKATSGYNPITTGNSYIQVVTWDDDGHPVARAILTYSQSPEPDSPHYADQTSRYSNSEWITLPFTDAEIEADTKRRLDLNIGP
jgi:acyl-homoserine-lactone acylase